MNIINNILDLDLVLLCQSVGMHNFHSVEGLWKVFVLTLSLANLTVAVISHS